MAVHVRHADDDVRALDEGLERVRARFVEAGIDAYFGVRREHMRYLTGFSLADGEEKVALNEKTYELDSSMTVIADASSAHDIGGIMGGEHSGVDAGTTDIILECAFFDPESVARTGQRLRLAANRF